MKTSPKSLLAPLCAGLLLITIPVVAQNSMDGNNPDSGHGRQAGSQTSDQQTTIHGKTDMKSKVSRADRRFFKKAAHLGEKEVALSRIASERAINPQVRSFAAEMVRAHTAANTELASLMSNKGVALDDRDRANEQRELARKWNDKKADDFDKDYLDALIDSHEDTIDVLENGAESKDADIAAYSGKLLPAIKAHLDQAERLEKLLD